MQTHLRSITYTTRLAPSELSIYRQLDLTALSSFSHKHHHHLSRFFTLEPQVHSSAVRCVEQLSISHVQHCRAHAALTIVVANTKMPPKRRKEARQSGLKQADTVRFRKHVTFNNVNLGEPTKQNFPSYTLVVRHLGYASNQRRSRTFMVGIDDHEYSDEALQWLFGKFVDDGDEIVCVRVVEKDVRQLEADKRQASFQKEANAEVERIKAKCGDSKAISIVLEYAVGKLHSTFQRLVRTPVALIDAYAAYIFWAPTQFSPVADLIGE